MGLKGEGGGKAAIKIEFLLYATPLYSIDRLLFQYIHIKCIMHSYCI